MADANQIQGLEELIARLREIAGDAKHIRRPLLSAGVYMLGSIEKNFQEQGRPVKWMPLSPRTLAGRRGARKSRKKAGAATGRGSRILIDMARLKNSMATKVVDGQGVAVGTNVVYAARQQFGFKGVASGKRSKTKGLLVGWQRGKSYTPSRPFLLFQSQDIDAIGRIFQRHIAKQQAE
jgi:phage gpG-like protein